MAIIGSMEKQPIEVLDYDVDFSAWVPSTDFIASVTATVRGGGTLNVDSTEIFDGTWVKVWLSDGDSGVTYVIELTATTDDGRVKQVEFKVRVKEV